MLESLDLDLTLTREDYAARRPNYDRELFDLVRRAKAGHLPVVILFEGTELAGKGQAIFTLTEKLDPRVAAVHPTARPRKFERERPWLWRFWMKLPARGDIAIFDESWYRRVLAARFTKEVKKREWRVAFEEIASLERALVEDGTLIIKLFLHVDRKTQRRRIERLANRGLEVRASWRDQQRRFGAWERTVEEMLERTSSSSAPWTLVPGTCRRYARAKVFETVITELRRTLDERGVPTLAPPVAAAPPAPPNGATAFESPPRDGAAHVDANARS